MSTSLHLVALLAGIGLAVQVGLNGTLRQTTGSAGFAALASFTVGLTALSLYLLLTRTGLPSRAALASVPAWAWVGGLSGAFYVASATIVGPRLGGATLLALTMLGQLATALVLDHFGWLGFPQHALSASRLAGAALLISGVLLVTR